MTVVVRGVPVNIAALQAENARLQEQLGALLGHRPRPLSTKQRRLLDLLIATIRDGQLSPTQEEIARALGYKAASTVHDLLLKLENKGWIHRSRGAARAITILAKP